MYWLPSCLRYYSAFQSIYRRNSLYHRYNPFAYKDNSSGSCNLCKPGKKKLVLECAKPKIMRYSLESTGINVQSLVQDVGGYELKWYEKTKKSIPPYITVVTMILHNNFKSNDEICKIISQNIISCL